MTLDERDALCVRIHEVVESEFGVARDSRGSERAVRIYAGVTAVSKQEVDDRRGPIKNLPPLRVDVTVILRVYHRRVANPSPTADFSRLTYVRGAMFRSSETPK